MLKKLINLRNNTKQLMLLLSLTLMVSCTPSDNEISPEDLRGDVDKAFTGVTEVQTISDTKVTISWSTSNHAKLEGYNVYIATISSAPVLIKTVDKNTTSTTISGLNEAFLYKFRVRLRTSDGEEDDNTNDVAGIPYGGATSSLVQSATSVLINYNSPLSGEALLVKSYCQLNGADEWQLMGTVTDMSKAAVILTGLVPNTNYSCRVNVIVDGKEDNNLARVDFVALGQADHLLFSTQPGNAQAGELLSVQPIVTIYDDNNNVVSGGPDSTVLVTLTVAVASPTVGSVSGTFAMNAVAGVADFTDLFIQEAGLKVLTASKADTSGLAFGTGIMTLDSAGFNITSGAVSPLLSTLVVAPAGPLIANGVDSYAVTFTLKDSFGNPVSGQIPNFASNVIGDFLTQPLLATDALGQTTGSIGTTISDTNNPAVTRTLRITAPAGLDTVQAFAPFDPGPATKLAYILQPTNSPAGALGMAEVKVAVQDAQGNVITSALSPASTTNITLSINNNIGGAVLSGTTAKNAVAGVATFSDLGIDITANGYSLAASAGVLAPGISNNFNINAGIPKVISMTGDATVLSGDCSAAITLQLQDFGGNPAKAISNTTVILAGLGNASIYSSSSCIGAPLAASVLFTPGTDTKTLYLTSPKVENLNITGTDASTILVASAYNIKVTPSKMSLAVVGGSPLKVPSNTCSTALEISPLADDGSAGEVFGATTISLTGIIGSEAVVYSDAACVTMINPATVSLVIGAGLKTRVYLRDPKGETLLVNVSDPSGDISTVSLPQDVIVGPSEMTLTGPATVVSGICSAVFTVTLRDSQGAATPTTGNKNLTIDGIAAYPSGNFYTSPVCGGGGSNTTVVVPDGASQATVYFKGLAAAVLNIKLTDAGGEIADSTVVNLTVTPSAFRITAPVGPTESLSSICVGPFNVETLDGTGSVSSVVIPVTANLSGGGAAGLFYSDATCDTNITSLLFGFGESLKPFYFKGQYPEILTLIASDPGAVLTSGTQAWTVTAGLGWFGTASKGFDGSGDLLPFRSGYSPVAARYDGFRGAQQMAMSPDNSFLYVADYTSHKILKYDYATHAYIGWMGRLLKENGIGSNGSNIPVPSSALCVATNNYETLPGWCKGGRSVYGNYTTGGLYQPWGITADANYVYVTSYGQHLVSRYDAVTGEFDGYIGMINTVSPTANGTGAAGCAGAPTNAVTPGWCIGGNSKYGGIVGDGRMRYPTGMDTDAVYLYVANERAIMRYDKTTGAFAGWIGRVSTTSPTGDAPGSPGGCAGTLNDQITPGWCIGGTYEYGDPRNTGAVYQARDVIVNGADLYTLSQQYGGVINKYNATTGAFVETLSNLSGTWTQPRQFAFDGTNFYVADDERILKLDNTGLMLSWMGKVANNVGMSGNPGCDSLSPNDNTPGWCLGGTHKPGLEEEAFINTWGIVYDGTSKLLVTSRDMPSIKKFDKTTGNYEGSMGLESVSPTNWVADYDSAAEYEGFDDQSFYAPMGTVIVGDFMYITEQYNSRIKKVNKKTGEVLGQLGGMTSVPTGGEQTAACLAANAMSPAPGYCKGALPYPNWTWNDANMIDDLSDGIMQQPYGITSDGTWIYVTDYAQHRIQKFNAATGSYGGWIGRITVSPTGGAPGCSGAAVNSFTPGWCLGGRGTWGTGDGHLRNPTGMTYQGGNLYVIDSVNHRVSSYSAVTGAFNGWIGRIGAAPSGGCAPASNGDYNVSTTGWCTGGTAAMANYGNDRGGGFNFNYGNRSGIFSDGVHLFITNTRNIRIDKFTLGGVFVEATRTRADQYVNTWKSAPADVANVGNGINCSYPMGVWADATHIYGINSIPCSRDGDTMSLWKMDKATGTIIGWKGGASAAYPPLGGDVGCAGATGYTPGWCTGGRVAVGLKLGQFAGVIGLMTGDANYLYVTDRQANRIVRVPK